MPLTGVSFVAYSAPRANLEAPPGVATSEREDKPVESVMGSVPQQRTYSAKPAEIAKKLVDKLRNEVRVL